MAERPNVLEDLTNQQLLNRYRFNRLGLIFLSDLLKDIIGPITKRSKSLSAIEKILITLRFLATGFIQLNDADLHGVSQPTVSKVISQVIEALSSVPIVRRFVNFPVRRQELENEIIQFHSVAGFPQVVGVIDGTQIRISAPSENEEIYVNRKGYHSINVQLVFNFSDMVTNVVANFPGSVHDSRILRNSGIQALFENYLPNGHYHLLGDSGYPSKKWLLTPYLEPRPGYQSDYNRSHKKTRSKVEKGIGQLKRRFGVLHGEIRMRPEKACKVVLACVVLHNICKSMQIPLGDIEDEGNNDNDLEELDVHPDVQNHGLRYRDNFAQMHFW